MPFVGDIFSQLEVGARTPSFCKRFGDGQVTGVTGGDLLELIRKGAHFPGIEGSEERRPLRLAGAEQHSLGCDGSGALWPRGDRGAALCAAGSGGIGRDDEGLHAVAGCAAGMRCCRDAIQRRSGRMRRRKPYSRCFLATNIFAGVERMALERLSGVQDADPVTIIYTSGTSGEAKGVMLTAANVGFMLGCTSDAA